MIHVNLYFDLLKFYSMIAHQFAPVLNFKIYPEEYIEYNRNNGNIESYF